MKLQVPGLSGRFRTLRVLASAGLLAPERPDKMMRELLALVRRGPTMAAASEVAAIRYPDELAVVDPDQRITFAELRRQTNGLARGLADMGLAEGQGVGILCLNGAPFVQTVIAASKLGCHAMFLNTSFSGPQLAGVLERERPNALVYDSSFEDLVGNVDGLLKITSDGEDETSVPSLIASNDQAPLSPPGERGKVVILTSGTTGTPKGASRQRPSGLDPLAAFLSIVPYRARETMLMAPPIFHAHAYGQFEIGFSLSSTFVLRSRFDALDTLETIEREGVTAMPVVPVMLKRLLDLPKEDRRRFDTSSLRVVLSSGSALPAELANRFMDEFGDVLYNLYGSTEVAWATIASPEDMRAAPGTAGRAPLGTEIEILDAADEALPPGKTGRIFVGHEMLFEGYTGDDTPGKQMVRGLMSTGDLGHFDESGRLFVEGREDEMIVSGGENVYPQEVEDLLDAHPAVAEAAVVGVSDEEFGQRLQAHVALEPGGEVSEEELRAHVKSHLARYKVPREVIFHDELPRNATGKILKKELSAT